MGRIKGVCADCVRAELFQVGNVSSAASGISKRVDIVVLYRADVRGARVSGDAILTFPVVVPLLEIPA